MTLTNTNGHRCEPGPGIDSKYIGARNRGGTFVTVRSNDGIHELTPRIDLIRHEPTGFDWGRSGTGAAQLALALLADVTGNDQFALRHYQVFHREIIARLPQAQWELNGLQALQALRFVSEEARMPLRRERRKMATIRAYVQDLSKPVELNARGSGRGAHTAATRALLNLLGSRYLRRRRITALQIELSVFNVSEGPDENVSIIAGPDDA